MGQSAVREVDVSGSGVYLWDPVAGIVIRTRANSQTALFHTGFLDLAQNFDNYLKSDDLNWIPKPKGLLD